MDLTLIEFIYINKNNFKLNNLIINQNHYYYFLYLNYHH